MAETPANIQADRAWGHFAKTLAYNVPKHLNNAQQSWRHLRAMRKVK